MEVSTQYDSPLGRICIAADAIGITGLWFAGQKHFPQREFLPGDTPLLRQAQAWLDVYFSGKAPEPLPPLNPRGTAFQREIWTLLLRIPFGQTRTYGELAAMLGKPGAAQAVGSAVGRNPISVFIPCHRVVGADGALTGYAGGPERKAYLLKLERNAGLSAHP